jgi:hypothetical protein
MVDAKHNQESTGEGQFKYLPPLTDGSSSLASLISAIKDLLQESLRSYRFAHFTYVAVLLITSGWIGYRKRLHYPSPYLYRVRAKPWPVAACI